jgi:hypothetical protein
VATETQTGALAVATETQTGALDAEKLRELASWYREFAEPVRQARLRMAEDLEHEADLLEQKA